MGSGGRAQPQCGKRQQANQRDIFKESVPYYRAWCPLVANVSAVKIHRKRLKAVGCYLSSQPVESALTLNRP